MDLIAVAAFLNPAGWKSRVRNFEIFRRFLKRQRVPLCVVECKRPQDGWCVDAKDVDFCFRYEAPDALWQKERLFNLGVERLSSDFGVVALVDTDVVFENRGWAAETSRLIGEKNHGIVQPYSKAIILKKEDVRFAHGSRRNWREGFAKALTRAAFGHPGFAMAFDRGLIQEVGLYDRLVLGGGDSCISIGTCGSGPVRFAGLLNDEGFIRDAGAWRDRWRKYLANKRQITYVPGRIFHLWHGRLPNRRYRDRYSIFRKHDLRVDQILAPPGEPLRFADSVTDECRRDFLDYFKGRSEDD